MTTELVLLLFLSLFIIGGVFRSPPEVFKDAGASLGARVEVHLNTGAGFVEKSRPYPSRVW